MIDLSTEKYQVIRRILFNLGLPSHRIGYWYLFAAIPVFAFDPTQSLTKELYPRVAKLVNCPDWRNIEHAIRTVILHAWVNRNQDAWNDYFPKTDKCPSNKLFLSVLSQHIK